MTVSASERKAIQICLDLRARVTKGLSMLKELLHENSSKLTVSICSFLAKRVLMLSRENS
jgi:hypothetical protein